MRLIPFGKCTTYGHIAKLIGYPNYSRMVGRALHDLGPGSNVPFQRVVNSKGIISAREPPGSAARQAILLRDEQVQVDEPGIYEDNGVRFEGSEGGRVNLRVYGWFPSSLQ